MKAHRPREAWLDPRDEWIMEQVRGTILAITRKLNENRDGDYYTEAEVKELVRKLI